MGFLKTGYKAVGAIVDSMNPMKAIGVDPRRPWRTWGEWGKNQRKQGKKVFNGIKKAGEGVIYGVNQLDGVRVNLHSGKILGAAKHAKNIITKNDDSWFRKASESEDSIQNYALNHPIMNDVSVKSNHFGGGDDFNGITPLQTGVTVVYHIEKLNASGTFAASPWGEPINSLYRNISRKLGRNPGYTAAEFTTAMELLMQIYARYTTLLSSAALSDLTDTRNPRAKDVIVNDMADVADANKAITIAFLRNFKFFLKDSVRIPVSMANYINWRYGHMYKINKCRTSAYSKYAFTTATVAQLTADRATLETSAVNNQIMSDLVEIFPNSNKLDWDPEVRYDLKEVQMRDNLTETRITSGVQRVVLKEGLLQTEAVRAAVLSSRIAQDGSTVDSPFAVMQIQAYYINASNTIAFFDPTLVHTYASTETVTNIENELRFLALIISSGYTGAEYVFANTTTAKVLPMCVPPGDHIYMTVQQVIDIQRDACAALMDVN